MDRFTQRNMRPTELLGDSSRMRVRLDAALGQILPSYQHHSELASYFRANLGVWVQQEYRPFENFELRDVLDGITVAARFFHAMDTTRGRGPVPRARAWIEIASTVLREEHVAYRLDASGMVHFAVDEDFEHNRVTTLAGLDALRYAAARREYEEAFKALRTVPPNGKAAIRGVFTAVETVFKLMFLKAPRLGGAEIRTHLKPVVARNYAADVTASRSMDKTAESFVDWTDASHFYRHAQGEEEPTEPPLETTVLLISQGSAYLRWLMTVDAAEQARAGTTEPAG